MSPPAFLRRLLTACLLLLSAEAALAAAWADALQRAVERIDADSPGRLGVYVKRLDNGETFGYGADTPWYLGSTVKVPIAIAVLQDVDAGRLKLSDRVTLAETDRIEAGQVVWSPAGTVFTVDALLTRMLGDSDNTAANMLIRTVGEERLNESAKAAMGPGFSRITSLAQVRYDVYAELHPDARRLSNDQLVRIASVPLGPERVEAVRRALGKKPAELKAKTIDDAYASYYRSELNTATLVAYGAMLEKLVQGRLLSAASTERLFTAMKLGIFTNYRLQAGLPRSVGFIHKTGTQYRRACHAGVIAPQQGGAQAIVVATCAADIDEQRDAGVVFERVGRAVTEALLSGR